MVVNEHSNVDDSVPLEAGAQVHFHPKTADANLKMAKSLAQEFRRWMADEIEEIAELVDESAREGTGPRSEEQIATLADQLAEQAEMLGYPHIVEIAERLKQCAERGTLQPDSTLQLDEQIAELRTAIGR
jgi:HPt (histidine-containing phosphotransfer) domain-containing protein